MNTKTLKEIAKINYGKSPKDILSNDGIFPVIGTGGVERKGNKYLYDGESIILPRKGTIDRIVYINGKFWTIDTAFYLTNFKNVDVKWLFYFLNQINFKDLNSATGVPSISRENLSQIKIVFPSKPEQSLIAEILSTVDRAIEQTEAVIAKLQRIKAGLMQDLLTSGIDEQGNIRSEKTHRFKDSPLGRIPVEWKVVNIDGLAINLDQKRIPIKEEIRQKRRGPFPYYGASGIIDWIDDYLFEGEYVLLGEDGENVVSRNLPLAFKVSGKFWVNNHAHVFKPKVDTDIDFLTELLEYKDYLSIILGSAQPKITQSGLKKLFFVKPPHLEQKRISNVLKNFNDSLNFNILRKNKLLKLKTALIQDLLTGRVRVTRLLK